MADIYTNLLKPVVDLIIFTIKLALTVEITGPVGMYLYFGLASLISALVIPPYAKLAAVKQEKEGRFRELEKRIITNAEMVAFMGGESPEKSLLNQAFASIFEHKQYVATRKLFADIVMGYVNKYAASSVGFLLLVFPYYTGFSFDLLSFNFTNNVSFYQAAALVLRVRSPPHTSNVHN